MHITVKEFMDDILKDYQPDDIMLKFEIIVKRQRSTSVRYNPNWPKYEQLDAPQITSETVGTCPQHTNSVKD
jgi:hypothetical protein